MNRKDIEGRISPENHLTSVFSCYTVVHTRTGFEDWPERKRVLWRLWLRVPDFRPATPYSAQWSRGVNLTRTQQQIQLVYSG